MASKRQRVNYGRRMAIIESMTEEDFDMLCENDEEILDAPEQGGIEELLDDMDSGDWFIWDDPDDVE